MAKTLIDMPTQDAPEQKWCENCTEQRMFPPRLDRKEMIPFYYDSRIGWVYRCPVCDSPDDKPLDEALASLINGPGS